MACVSTALIIGGGIAGLSAAIALSRVGVQCEVVELSETHLGASLGLSGRAAEALDELGVYDACYATGAPWPVVEKAPASIMDATGRLLSPPPHRPEWPGAKTAIGVYRPVFMQILADAATGLGVKIRTKMTAQTIEDGADGALVTLSNGEQHRYDMVVGADGIGSRTRVALFPDAPKPAYSGQASIRWMAPGPDIHPEGWYLGPLGRVGFYYLPHQGMIYVPTVVSIPEWTRMSDEDVYAMFKRLMDSYSAPALVELRERLNPQSDLICRPFEWILLTEWRKGRTILIGDAAHATTAHMGMGGGMALEDSVVLAQCVAKASTLEQAYQTFMARRFERVRTVVETSVKLSKLEQAQAPPSENRALLNAAFETLAAPY